MVDQFDDENGTGGKDHLIPLNRKEKPTKSVAVSLKYDLKTDDVPEITAAGRGKIAEKILQIALENNIPVREDGNHIVFAFRDPAFAPRWHWMRSQALALQGRLGLDFPGFAQQLEAGARQGHAQRLAR